MNNKKMLSLIFTFIFICLFCLVNVKAWELKTFKQGDKVCVDVYVNNFGNDKYIYTWEKSSNTPAYQWPGKKMTLENGVYCYTIDSNGDNNDMVIFSNNNGKQTIDLSSLGGGLIYVFGDSDYTNGQYKGTWRVYDKSELINEINKFDSFSPLNYTLSSYQKVLNVLAGENGLVGARALSNMNYIDNYNELVITESNGKFTSIYETVLNNLKNAVSSLENRNIIVQSVTGGSVNYQYEENSNTKMVLTSTEDPGYELSGLTISNDSGIVKDFKDEIANSEPFTYEYNDENLTINPSYVLKKFNINFIIGQDGKIYDLETGEEEVTAPITVEYGKNRTLKIVANPGYDVQNLIVDGADYELNEGKLEIKNVQKDVEVEVSFTLKKYTITIGETNHIVSHGSDYDYLLGLVNKDIYGYDFDGLYDVNGNKIQSDYKVTGNAVFKPNFIKKKYKISFTVGQNGVIYDPNDPTKTPITAPVTVEYEDNYTLKVVANEGYDVDKVTVDGTTYELTDGEVKIENVKKDVNVEVSFKLKEYKIKVDDTEYKIAHGTSYSDLLKQITTERKGYDFKGLENKNGLLDSNYIVLGDDELSSIYERKTYKITLIVGKDGKVYDTSDNEVTSPITVKYEDDYTLKIVANEGYDVRSVTVDGIEYKLTNGQVKIKNVQKDLEVKVDFKLKAYKVEVDGENYNIVHGTTYEELLKQIKTTKKGYVFKGIKNSDGEILDENYVVNSSDKLEIIYEKDPIIEVPSTGDSIIGYVMIFMSALIALSVFFITRKKKCKN